MPDQSLTLEMTEFLYLHGSVLTGFADLTILPSDIRQQMPFGIVFALPINADILATLLMGPTREYAAEYVRLNNELNIIGYQCVNYLTHLGYLASMQGSTLDVIDTTTYATPLPHKTVATRAGLGWIGKSALLVTKEFGSAIRFNTILTNAPLNVGIPIEQSMCGDCVDCLRACPGGAPSGKTWHVELTREDFFDASACARTAKQLSDHQGITRIICGRCIGACPWTQRYLSHLQSAI